MALVFMGLTRCALCGEVLTDSDAIKGLPPMSDTQHPLHEYFDAGFHAQCFDNWDKKEEALRILEEDRQKYINSDSFKEMVAKHGKPKWLNAIDE
jgi:hypothetical protein